MESYPELNESWGGRRNWKRTILIVVNLDIEDIKLNPSTDKSSLI